MRTMKIVLLAAPLVLAACSRDPEPVSRAAATSTSTSTSTGTGAGAGTGASTELVWTAPSAWSVDPTGSSMRIVTYAIPKASGDSEDATLAVSLAGGSVDANVERWVGQFSPATKNTRSERKVGALPVTLVELHGTFAGGMGPGSGPKNAWMLLGAIVPAGTQSYFFKMTGPEKTVDAARRDFDTFLNSLHSKGS